MAPLDQHPGVGRAGAAGGRRHPHRAGGRLNAGSVDRGGPLPTLTPVYRRAWVLMVVLAVGMAAWAIIEAIVLDKKLIDPEGSFLGPSYIRLPLLLLGALLLDLLPLTICELLAPAAGDPGDRPGPAAHALDQGADHPRRARGSSASTSST